ncbi:hypothetical protein BH23ACT5_BH23ACT5_01290 [soil metagenome]
MTSEHRVLEGTTLTREFLVTSDETEGPLVEMRVTYRARSPFPPPHLHPFQTETFVVEEGEMLVRLNGHESTLQGGSTLVVSPGSVHQMRNATDTPTIVNWKVEPALCTAEFFITSHALEGASLLDRALLVSSYRDVFRLAIQPRPVIGAAVAALGFVARLSGRSLPGLGRPGV